MASHIVAHVDGKKYRREFPTGRGKKPQDAKFVQQGLKLPPSLKQHVPQWKQIAGKSYAAWVQDQMREAIAVYTETV